MTLIEHTMDHGIARVVLNRPDKKNAIDTRMWAELERALGDVRRSPDVRVLVLSAAGNDFCVGADLSSAEASGNELGVSHRTQLERMQWINSVVLSLRALKIPTIARVDGLAVGIGMNLAMCCDFVVASERARFSEIFIRRALTVDGGGSWLLPRLAGIRQAKRLCMLGEMVSADEALRLGLVTAVTDVEALDGAVETLVGKLVSYSRTALAQTKSLLDDAYDSTFEQSLDSEARVQSLNVAGDDFKAAVAAFTTKSPTPATNAEVAGG